MALPEWLRFATLSMLALWLCMHYIRPERLPAGLSAALLGASGLLAIGQLFAQARAATDQITSIWEMLASLAPSPYGILSLVASGGALLLAFLVLLLRRRRQPTGASSWPLAATMAAGLALLLCCGAASATVAPAVNEAQSSGEIAMSPTLIVPRSAQLTVNPYANDPASAERGKLLFEQHCQVCHGINGDGNGPAGANLRIPPASFRNPQHYLAPGMDGLHYWVIQHGDGQPGGMPAWGGTLTPQQTWDVLNYVKQLAAKG